jgi:hypothetical protein
VFPIDVNPLSTAENPRAILDRKNEVTFALLDYAAGKRELYAKLGPITSPGDAYDVFAYILYQTSAAASGLVFKVRNVKVAGNPTDTLPLVPKVLPGWDDSHGVTPGGAIWATGAMPNNAWDFSEVELWVDFTNPSPAGWCRVFQMGLAVLYRPAQDVTKTERITIEVPTRAMQQRLNRLPWAHRKDPQKKLVEAVTESSLKGKFFSNMLGRGGAGDPFLVWKDDRGANTQIYIQSLAGSSGAEDWTAQGVQVGNSVGASRHLQSATCNDGQGGVFVAYLDRRNGTRTDLYAQHYNAAGVAQWAAGGVLLCNASDLEAAVTFGYDCYIAMVPDGAGGFVCSWSDCRGTNPADRLYITRIDSNGSLHSGWTANGNLVINLTTTGDGRVSGGHYIAASGGVFICVLNRSFAFGIKIQVVSAAGAMVGAVGSFSGVIGGKVVADGSGNFLVNYLGPANQCSVKKIDATGATAWTSDAANNTAAISANFVIPDGLGGCYVFWRSGPLVKAQRLNAAGVVQWAVGGVTLNATTGVTGYFFYGVSDGANGAILCWPDATTQTMTAQRLNPSGLVQWGPNGVNFSNVGGSPFGTACITDGAGGALSFYTIAGDVRCARISSAGTVLWNVLVTSATGTQAGSVNGGVYPNAADTEAVSGGGSVVKEAPDLASLILQTFAGVSPSALQVAAGLHGSFTDAKTRLLTWKQSAMAFGVQITKEISIEDVLEELGEASVSCIVQRASDGLWKFFPWRTGAAASYTAPLSKRDLVRPDSALELTPTPGPAIPNGLTLDYGPDDAGSGYAHQVSVSPDRSSAGYLYRNLRDGLLTISTGQNDRLDLIGASSGTLALNITPGAYTRASALTMLHGVLGASLGAQHAVAFGGLVVANVNDRFPFKVNGVFMVAILTPGEMTCEARAADVVAAMLAAGSGGTPSCSFSRTTRKYTIAMAGVASFGLEFFNSASNSAAALLGFIQDVYFGTLTYTSDGAVEECRFTLAAGEQITLPFHSGVNGQLGTKRSCWEFLGWDWNEDVVGIGVSPTRAGAIATAICPKFELEQFLAAQVLEPKKPTADESRWIFETATALEHRNRSIALGVPSRGYSKIRSGIHADAELHDTIDPMADLDAIRGYAVEGTDGSWAGKRLTVLEAHQHFGTTFDTELGGVDLSS